MTVPDNRVKLSVRHPMSIRQKVFKALRNQILAGTISPGHRLVEARIAEQIKTSRTPVREALHMLEMEGLLESIPRVGYQVKQLRWDEVEEICEIRAVNEALAAKWAIQRITSKELQALEENLETAERDVCSGNPKSFVEHDSEFHEILVRASGSARLLELCQLLRRHMLRYRIESLYLPDTALRAIEGHRRILDRIKGKDEPGVEEAIHSHLRQSKLDIQRYAFDKDPEVKAEFGEKNA